MKIKEYMDYQDNSFNEIMKISRGIDPKLLGVLSYEDLFNDKYRNEDFYHWYNDILCPKINQYKNNCSMYLHTVLSNIINESYLVLQNTGYLISTGEETTTFDDKIPSDYIPCVELEGIVTGVLNLEYRYQIRPYWNRNIYTITGNNETITIMPNCNSITEFIDFNRNQFNRSFGETNLGKLERAIQLRSTKFDYDIHIPQLSLSEDRSVTGKYEESIRRHLILQKLMQDECNGFMYSSTIDIEGNVTLTEIN